MKLIRRLIGICLAVLLFALALGGSSMPPGDRTERIRFYTRQIEFDYIAWTMDSIWLKIGQAALSAGRFVSPPDRPQVVLDYLDLVNQTQQISARINSIFADPSISDPQSASQDLRQQLSRLLDRRGLLQPVAESILEAQISEVAAEMGLTAAGQPIPPVSFHITPPPSALIVSPRAVIRQLEDISILPDLTAAQMDTLENQVDRALGVSSLVVGIGGVGLYPTMVMQTTSINWLADTVAHEWTHNILTIRPLGASYGMTPELRIMNETTASIAGNEIGEAVIARYYPAYVPPPPPPPAPPSAQKNPPPPPPAFNFNREMHTTRIKVDEFLQAGDITAAEQYMETRRRFFWDHGYQIRKLNQAYFAFYGAYADQPEGAAGQDPVGEAVRKLRADSPNLAAFISRIEWMWSFDQLKRAVQAGL